MMKPHNKKYYGGLIVIAFLILATAFLLQMYGSVDLEDIAGLAAEPTEQESIEDLLENGGTVEITSSIGRYTIVYDQTNRNYELQQPGTIIGTIISHDFSSYDAVLQDIAAKNANIVNDMSLVAYAEKEIQVFEDVRLTGTSVESILTNLQTATETAMDRYNEYYYPELYPTSEQEVTEEPAPEEADTGETGGEETGEIEETGDTGEEETGEGETGDTGAEDTGETAEEASDTGETAREETGGEEDTGDTEITFGEIEPGQIAVETIAPEEIIVSYKDANGNDYTFGAITYDGATYSVELSDGSILTGYDDKGNLLQDIQGMLQDENAVSVSFEEIKEGKSVATATSSIDTIGDDLNKVLEDIEKEALPEGAKTEEQKKAAEAAAAKGTGAKPAAPQKAGPSITINNDGTGTLKVDNAKYNLIYGEDNKVYAATTMIIDGKKQNVYVDLATGIRYDENYKERGTSTLLTEDKLKEIKASSAYKAWEKKAKENPTAIAKMFTGKAAEEKKKAEDRQKKLTSLASEYGVTITDITNEGDAINTYLKSADVPYVGYVYDAATEHYTGGTYSITYHGDNMGIIVAETKEGKTTTQTVYKSREKGKTTYYTIDEDGDKETVKETSELKKQFREAEKEQDRIVNNVGNGIKSGDIQNKITINGKEVVLKTTIAEAHYLQQQYEQQRTQVKGFLTGYLNKWLDKQLGGWSRGVPAGICAQVFGLEYYKEAGWNRVPMNASSYELQSSLLANSKTVIIEGEKEEITDSLFRYAYTLRLLANQSFEWQTYLYNSCSQETSEEVFYDYGSLGLGEFYSFHYAGAAEQDMIFDCVQEDCLFDQACVEFTDGSETVCVSLVHGAGFETPNSGSDYDCVVTE